MHGKKEVIEGSTISEAMNKHYSAGALRALDFYEQGESTDYYWDGSVWTWTEEKRKKMYIK